jgi:4-diphosphocytidyl-2-C-methyl-D-erythritol kinase
MRLLALAKINLHLRVGPPRHDGFHPLLSWMCTIGLFDDLEFSSAANSIELTCDDPSLPVNQDNLVVKAALALRSASQGVRIKLSKRIPAGGGLAGGSSDAATTLMGLAKLWNLPLQKDDLVRIAAQLGSDIAFFFSGPSGICSGLGEIVRPIPPPQARWALLILPPFGMPTPAVYRQFDQLRLGTVQAIDIQPDWENWVKLPAVQLLPKLMNDLESPAFDLNPELGRLRNQWEHRLHRPVRMSGSGSTLFTLYDLREEADEAAAKTEGQTARVVELAPAINP